MQDLKKIGWVSKLLGHNWQPTLTDVIFVWFSWSMAYNVPFRYYSYLLEALKKAPLSKTIGVSYLASLSFAVDILLLYGRNWASLIML